MSILIPKRRREADADDEDTPMRPEAKRIRTLPIRSPPTSKNNTFFSPQYQQSSQPAPILLTPVESSDDDLEGGVLDFDDHLPPSLGHSNASSRSSSSSVKVIVDDDGSGDMDMVDSSPPEQFYSPQPWQRQRSNDMLSPPRLPHLLDTQQRPGSNRIATPIYGHFGGIDVNLDRTQVGTRLPTTLSPLIREDDEPHWWRDRRFPSPIDDADEHMTPVGQADGMMGRLNMNNLGSPHSLNSSQVLESNLDEVQRETSLWRSVLEQQRRRERPSHEPVAPRSGRLTMGYRADCDKCIQKVPGHYSHVVWD